MSCVVQFKPRAADVKENQLRAFDGFIGLERSRQNFTDRAISRRLRLLYLFDL
jgi:hypothetical protein